MMKNNDEKHREVTMTRTCAGEQSIKWKWRQSQTKDILQFLFKLAVFYVYFESVKRRTNFTSYSGSFLLLQNEIFASYVKYMSVYLQGTKNW